MSVEATSWALQQQAIKDPNARSVLFGLANHANHEGRHAFPSIGLLCRYTGLGRRTVIAKLKLLQEKGVIRKGNQRVAAAIIDRADRRPTVYDLDLSMGLDDVETIGDEQAPDMPSDQGANSAPRGKRGLPGAGDAPREGSGVQNAANGVQMEALRSAGAAPEPSLTNPYSLSGAGMSPFDRAKHLDDDGQPPRGKSRSFPMTLDWWPDVGLFAAMAQRRGLPADAFPTPAELVDFADYFIKKGEAMTHSDWHARLARWVHENRQRQPMTPQAPTGGSDHAKRRQPDSQGDERRRVREALADPHDTSWADGWWPEDDIEATTGSGAGAGGTGVHPSGGDLSEDVLECVPECGPVEAEQTGAGAGDSELADAADSHGGGASHEQPEARGQYMATDDSGSGLNAGADSRRLWNASSW